MAGQMCDTNNNNKSTVRLGVATYSGDLTGHATLKWLSSFAGVAEDSLEAVLANFRGEIQQSPPRYAALKRDGKPLYEYARQGIELERAARPVTIFRLEILHFTGLEARLLVHCSKGT